MPTFEEVRPLLGLLIATLGGAAVGLERQWSGHAAGPTARFGGIRTFTLLGGVAGVSGWLAATGAIALAAVLLAAAAALVVAGYVAASRRDVDGTTEVAGLVVLGAGVLAGVGHLAIASGIFVLTSLLLVEKPRLHAMVARIDDLGLRAALRFGAMAVVVLPLLPAGPFGPAPGVRPRELWLLVLFFSGLSFAGYLARRMAGPGQGYVIAGALGGLVSSTNVTLTFARTSRTEPEVSRALGFGAMAGNAMLYPRVLLATAVLAPSLAGRVAWFLAPPFVAALIATVWGSRRLAPVSSAAPPSQNPLQLGAALQMAGLFQLVLILVYFVQRAFGTAGVVTTGAVLGLTDVDALTVSMARGAATLSLESGTAALGIAVGVLSNTCLKAGLAFVIGDAAFKRSAGAGLVLCGVASLLPLLAVAR